MVNIAFPAAASSPMARLDGSNYRAKSGILSVNEFLSKPFNFSENFHRILFE